MSERPASIVWFDRAYLASLAMTVVVEIGGWEQTIEADDPEWLGYAVFGLLTIVCALSILLWAAIVHRRSVRAKWVLTALNVATLPLSFIDTGPDLRSWEWQWAEIGSVVLSYAALVGLLTPAAKRWFRHDPGNLDQVFR